MDFKIVENLNGGDLVFEGGDLRLISEVYNQPYLARFGGNIENSTTDEFLEGDLHGDWFGNELFLSGKINEQLNSKFEKSLNEIPLSITNRKKLEDIALKDLEYLQGFASFKSVLSLPKIDKIKLEDEIVKNNNQKFSYIWENAKEQNI